MKVFDLPDLQALQQAMQPFEERYKVIRKVQQHYNDKGRYTTTDYIDEIKGAIIPNDTNLQIDSNGSGEWSNQTFTLYVIYPYWVKEGDIVLAKEYGRLRVDSINGTYKRGVLNASLTRTGSTEHIPDFKKGVDVVGDEGLYN